MSFHCTVSNLFSKAVWNKPASLSKCKLDKAVPLHATKAPGWCGGIAPTHSRPRPWMEQAVSVTPRVRFLGVGKGPPVPIVQEARWVPGAVWTQRVEDKSFVLCRGSNLDRPVVRPVARHYIDWATRLTSTNESQVYSGLTFTVTHIYLGTTPNRHTASILFEHTGIMKTLHAASEQFRGV
jgi:hypothetical protein